MRELESSLQSFGEFLLKAQLVRPPTAPYVVRWVRQFLSRPASDEPLVDRVRGFCEDLERQGRFEDWQVRQADQALRLYFVNFLKRTEWHRRPASTVVDEHERTSPLAALEQLRIRIRTRHYSYRTECTYVDWVRRFLDYAATQQGVPHPQVAAEIVRDYLAHLAVRQQVAASTQNQAFCAILFLCREVLGVNVENLSPGVRAKRGERLPVVMSMPETMALLGAMSGTPRLMAALIYGGGLRVSECCELRIKDLDFDQGLIVVRRGKGDKERSTLLAEVGRDELRAQLRNAEAQHLVDRRAGLAGVWMPDALDRKYPNAGKELAWFWVFPSRTLSTDPRAGLVRRHHMSDSVVQKAVKEAAQKARIHKPVSVHALRHSFATHLLLNGVDIRQIQEYLGHASVETTMIYTHVVKELRTPARSPLDILHTSTTPR
jgi:integron integrase